MSKNNKARLAKVTKLADRRESKLENQPRIGYLCRWSSDSGPIVDFPGNPSGPVGARSVVPLDADIAMRAIQTSQDVLLAFEAGEAGLPIILGILQPLPGRAVASQDSSPVQVTVDGQRVCVEGKERIELRCGKSSIVLTKEGKVLIRGQYISSRAAGANRIHGGSVRLN